MSCPLSRERTESDDGLISPQFHVRYDESFKTIQNTAVFRSRWQEISGLQPDSVQQENALTYNEIPTGANRVVVSRPNTEEDVTPELHDEAVFDNRINAENEGAIDSDESSHSPSNQSEEEDDSVSTVAIHQPRTTRSGRVSKFPKRYDDYILHY
jgi:hypothetical protein